MNRSVLDFVCVGSPLSIRLPTVAFIVVAFVASCGGSSDPQPSDGGEPSGRDAGGRTDAGPTGGDAGGAIRSDAGHSDAGGAAGTDAGASGSDLPSGDHGIAARHPGDVGIGSDSDVIFADDFESYADVTQVDTRWSNRFGNTRIATEAAHVHGGGKALEFRSPQQTVELSNGVQKVISPERDVLFLRFYSKFENTFDVVGSSHNGGGISAHYFMGTMATPGVPADGRNKFLMDFESWRGEASDPNPGRLNLYIYHPGQRSNYGDHFFPTGEVMPNTSLPGDFGPDFVRRAHVVPELDRWYCYELMVRANTPGMRDGRIAMWLDGVVIADFGNMRLRDVATLRMDRIGLSLHTGSNPVRETRKWYDDVVVATSYIGPVYHP